jgi:gliding motility-associated-like protein
VVNVRIEIPVVKAFATNIVGDEFSFTAQCVPDNATYAWTFSSGTGRTGNPVENTFADLDVYWATVTATTAAGCTDVDTVYMEPASQLHFPNAFTPDGDGINDLFGPVGYQLEQVEFSIYDRWGAVVFTTNAPGRGWDGRFANGTPAPTGVYVYTFRAKGERLTQREGYGSVTLLGQETARE